MSFNRYKYFRWTPRTALISFNFLILVPTLLTVAAYKTEVGFLGPPGAALSRLLKEGQAALMVVDD